ncbi:MAG TPA: glycosyltransferase [candidate division Zixibacteria bacterium]|nr:glycosyltransferase [candidate division Zixibacteria bacterium]
MSAPSPIPICYVISSITTGQAGTEGHVLRLIRGLDRARFRPFLVSLQRTAWTESFNDPDIPLTTLNFTSFKRPSNWAVIFELRRFFKQHDIRIAELYFTDAHLIGALAAKLAGVGVVISARRNLGYQYGAKELRLSKLGNGFVTQFVANSREVARTIARLEGIADGRIAVIHNGLNLSAFDVALGRAAPREFSDFVAGKKVVALAANLRPVKNVQGFLIAAYHIAAARADAVFVILGSGPDELSLKSFAEELGIAERVYWAGSVPETAPYLAHADVGCLSSDSEGFSNAIVEYMAAGLPVVATLVGGAAEAVIDGETGWLVRRGDFDALGERALELLNDSELAGRLGARGRVEVERRFTFAREVEEYQGLYERLAAS